MIYKRKEAKRRAQEIANENGSPVWIEYNLRWKAYFIHETPEGLPEYAWIIENEESPSAA